MGSSCSGSLAVECKDEYHRLRVNMCRDNDAVEDMLVVRPRASRSSYSGCQSPVPLKHEIHMNAALCPYHHLRNHKIR